MFERARSFAFAAALAVFAGAALAQTAQEIVAATDKVRNPGQPFRSTLTLTEFVAGKERSRSALVLFSKEDASHSFRNLLQYVEPARDAGLEGHLQLV